MSKEEVNIESLQDELVEAILLKLPLFSLGAARGVCKQWKRVMGSTRFKGLYTSPCTVFVHKTPVRCTSTLVDGCTRSLEGAVACYGKGLMLYCGPRKMLFGNIMTNKWDEITHGLTPWLLDRVLAFVMDGGLYKLVYWQSDGGVWTFDRESEWARLRQGVLSYGGMFPYPARCTHPLLANNESMFCLDCTSMELTEYNVNGRLLSTRLSALPDLKWNMTPSSTRLVVWEDKLYIVTVVKQVQLQVWEVLEDRSSASLVNDCNTKTINYLHQTMVDKNILHCYVVGPGDDAYKILYDMELKNFFSMSLVGNFKVISEKPQSLF